MNYRKKDNKGGESSSTSSRINKKREDLVEDTWKGRRSKVFGGTYVVIFSFLVTMADADPRCKLVIQLSQRWFDQINVNAREASCTLVQPSSSKNQFRSQFTAGCGIQLYDLYSLSPPYLNSESSIFLAVEHGSQIISLLNSRPEG